MKIAISAEEKNIDSLIDVRFGRCEYFQIHDTNSKEVIVVENSGLTCSGGAGIVASQQLIDENVNVIITGNLGPNAFEIIEKAEVRAYKCGKISVKSALKKFGDNELEEIKIATKAHNGMNY